MICEKTIIKYCCEDISRIENYEKAVTDTEQVWDCHHRRESIYTRKGLIDIGEYYNRPAIELVFMPRKVHMRLHNNNHKYRNGCHHSEETKKKISTSCKGKHVIQYTKDLNFVAEYPSALSAWRKTGICNISHVCLGHCKSAGGYIWRYKE